MKTPTTPQDVRGTLSGMLPEEDAQETCTGPVVEGVLTWPLDMGILNGNTDELFNRIERYTGYRPGDSP